MRVNVEAYLGYMTDFTKKIREKSEPFSLKYNEKIHYGVRNNRSIEPFMDNFIRAKLPVIPSYIGYNRASEYKDLETHHYKISRHKKSGYITIYYKKADTKVIMHSMEEIILQVDEKTGIRLLINNFGGGIYHCLQVGAELEWALKEALGTKSLNRTLMSVFQIHTNEKTGIHYITANGFESFGGHLLLNHAGREKMFSLANEFLKKYPNIMKSLEEAIMYVVCEITGVGKRLNNGLLMLGPKSISFYKGRVEERWCLIFEKIKYDRIRKDWDNKTNYLQWGKKEFWKEYFNKKFLSYEEAETVDFKILLKEYVPDNKNSS